MTATSIGNTLKETRTKKALTLDDVHAKIKIHPRVLQLLEEGKFDKLPSPLFAKSFLRSYADFLGVNAEEVLDAYEKTAGSVMAKEAADDQVLFIKTVEERKEEEFAHKNLFNGALLVGGIVVGVFLLSMAVGRMADMVKQKKLPNPSAWITHKPLTGEAAKAAKPMAAASTTVKPEAPKKKSDEWVRSPEEGNFPKISKKAPLELRLRALDNVWIRILADGKTLYQGILGRNAVETWTAKDTLEIWTGNAANMFLSVNRFSLGSPGRGMIRKMVITREGVRIPTPENR